MKTYPSARPRVTGPWPCIVCRLPGRWVNHRGDACEDCQRAAAAWDPPTGPLPTTEQIAGEDEASDA